MNPVTMSLPNSVWPQDERLDGRRSPPGTISFTAGEERRRRRPEYAPHRSGTSSCLVTEHIALDAAPSLRPPPLQPAGTNTGRVACGASLRAVAYVPIGRDSSDAIGVVRSSRYGADRARDPGRSRGR